MLRKIPFDTSAPVLARFALSEEGAALVDPELSPEEALAALYAAGLFVDLVHYFAYAMPPREGVCWALAVQDDVTDPAYRTPESVELRAKAARWVRDPQEAIRVMLMQAAENRAANDPLGWLCNAVAWNGSGSMGPVDGPVVLPPQHLHAGALVGAVGLLAGDTADSMTKALKAVHARGMDVARGGWPLPQP